jgi:hypothetical protein
VNVTLSVDVPVLPADVAKKPLGALSISVVVALLVVKLPAESSSWSDSIVLVSELTFGVRRVRRDGYLGRRSPRPR